MGLSNSRCGVFGAAGSKIDTVLGVIPEKSGWV